MSCLLNYHLYAFNKLKPGPAIVVIGLANVTAALVVGLGTAVFTTMYSTNKIMNHQFKMTGDIKKQLSNYQAET